MSIFSWKRNKDIEQTVVQKTTLKSGEVILWERKGRVPAGELLTMARFILSRSKHMVEVRRNEMVPIANIYKINLEEA